MIYKLYEGDMLMVDYKKLQNGSDIRGVAVCGVEGEEKNLTEKEAANIAEGFARWLRENKGKEKISVAVGRDCRISGPALLKGLAEGFANVKVTVYDCGYASTPAMFMATLFDDIKADGGIMITASHLPFNRNGFKFFTKEGGLDKADISAILGYAQEAERGGKRAQGQHEAAEKTGEDPAGSNVIKTDLMSLYSMHLRNLIKRGTGGDENPLDDMKIVVDAGNGCGGCFAEDVLAPLGADISCSQYLEPDGNFPNHAPNPEDKAAMRAVSEKVVSSGADFGIIFDTDVDRSAAVDASGKEIARNGIVAMAAALVAEDHPSSTVVTDSITSRQLTGFIEGELGLKHLRYRRGYKNVINKAKELNKEGIDCHLAIETSGHAAFKENYFLDDGAYLAVKIVIKAANLKKEGKSLESVLAALKEPLEEDEIRIPIKGEDFSAYADKVLDDLEKYSESEEGMSLEKPNYEGVRINFDLGGWCLVRKSLHDPIMPVNMASDKKGGCSVIREKLRGFLRQYEKLDTEGRL